MTDKNYIYKKLSDGRYVKEIDNKTEHLATAQEDAKLATDIRSLLQGPQGDSGTSGTSGESGTSGRDGAKGDIGRTGLTGPRGLNGTSGSSGSSGQDGSSGVNGQDGTSGINGRKGDKGDKGDRGFPGLQGPAGAKGQDGVIGSDGTSGVNGTSGSAGVNGSSGSSGTDGSSGSSGSSGTSGLDTSIVLASIKNTNYTFGLSDVNKIIIGLSHSALVFTVPLNSVTNFNIGSQIMIARGGTASLGITYSAGVNLNSANNFKTLNSQYSGANLVKIDTDDWLLFGDLNV